MSKELRLEDLEGMPIDSLKDTILKYHEALNKANENTLLGAETNKKLNEEKVKFTEAIKLLHEENNKLSVKLNETIAQLNEQDLGLGTLNQSDYDNLVSEYNKLIDELKVKDEEISSLQKTIKKYSTEKDNSLKELAQNNSQDLDKARNKIHSLEEEIKSLNEKIRLFSSDKGFIPKKESDLIVQTYNIKGFDNRAGTKSLGGREFNKISILVKFSDNTLIWNIESKTMDIDSRHQIILDENQKKELLNLADSIGWFKALKTYLQIPDEIENTIPDVVCFKYAI